MDSYGGVKYVGVMLEAARFAEETRLRFLDGLFFWEGRANRRDLIERFQISPAQAALDLKTYLGLTQRGHVRYDTRAKRYVAAARFSPVFGLPEAAPWLFRQDTREKAPVDVLPTLSRPIDLSLMARLYRAIRDREALCVRYQSMSRPEPEDRWIAPTALASDGQRWHARAYCYSRESYRDFVLSRMKFRPIRQGGARKCIRVADQLPPDAAWSTFIELDLAPADNLGEAQSTAVRHEYGFVGDVLKVRVRSALEFYALRRWGLDRPDSRLAVRGRRVVAGD